MYATMCVFRRSVLVFAATMFLMAAQHAAADSILLVAGVDNQNIGAFNSSTGASEGIFSNTFARGLATASNGNVLTATNNVIGQISPTGTTLAPFFTYSASDIVLKLAVDTAGDVYALTQLSNGNSEVDKFSSAGTFLNTVVPAGLFNEDVQVAANGNVVVDNFNDIITYDSSGHQIGREFFPGGVSFDLMVLGNNVFASIASQDYGSGSYAGDIFECAGCANGSGTMSLFGTDPTQNSNLQELIPGPGGDILVADRDRNTVIAFDSNGNYLGVFAQTYNFQTGQGTFGPFSMTYIDGGPAASGGPGPATPEPMTLAMFGTGLLGLARRLRKRAA